MFAASDRDLEHPVITNLRQTGYPDRREPEEVLCPCCGRAPDTIYQTRTGDTVGCTYCLNAVPWYEFEED